MREYKKSELMAMLNENSLEMNIDELADFKQQGGIAVVGKDQQSSLALPIAGLMSTEDGDTLAQAYTDIDAAAKKLGTTLKAPFMTLSFMALLVIPNLKLSDKGLFDGVAFTFTPLQL